jgi:hypothetical protein
VSERSRRRQLRCRWWRTAAVSTPPLPAVFSFLPA